MFSIQYIVNKRNEELALGMACYTEIVGGARYRPQTTTSTVVTTDPVNDIPIEIRTKCKKCKTYDHTYFQCPLIKRRICGQCGKEGHTRITCSRVVKNKKTTHNTVIHTLQPSPGGILFSENIRNEITYGGAWVEGVFNTEPKKELFFQVRLVVPETCMAKWREKNNQLHRRYEEQSEPDKKFNLYHYLRLWIAQGGRCPICKPDASLIDPRPGAPWRRKAVVDHNHKDGNVRKLLCPPHNTMIGLGEEDRGVMGRSVSYLHVEGNYEK